MSYDLVLEKTKKIESILNKMGAEGKGLHEKSQSIENKLDTNILKSIKFIATVRNKLLHEEDFILQNQTKIDFIKKSDEVIRFLDMKNKRKKQNYCNVSNEHLDKKPYLRAKVNRDNLESAKVEKNYNPFFIVFFLTLIVVFIVKQVS